MVIPTISTKRRPNTRAAVLYVSALITVPLLALMFGYCDGVTEQRDQWKEVAIRQSAALQRMAQSKTPDIAKTCSAWWTGSTDLVQARRQLCPKSGK